MLVAGGARKHLVGSRSAVESGASVLADVGGTEVALFVCRGRIVATQGQCPHNQGPLHEGDVTDTVLTCPWHGWTFDLATGECLEDDSIELKRYPVEIEGDDVFVLL